MLAATSNGAVDVTPSTVVATPFDCSCVIGFFSSPLMSCVEKRTVFVTLSLPRPLFRPAGFNPGVSICRFLWVVCNTTARGLQDGHGVVIGAGAVPFFTW